MKKFIVPDRRQKLLLANVDLDSVALEGSAVRIINDFVDKLNTKELENEYKLKVLTGQTPIHPKTILKVALFAIHNCRFSLRKMEEDIKNNLLYRWLTGDIRIDHSTIGRFLVKNKEHISEMFTQIVLIAVSHDLVGFEVLGIDSLKIRANASYKQERTLKEIEKEETKLKEKIKEILETIEKESEPNESKEKSKGQKKILERRKKKIEKAKEELEERIKEKSAGKKEKEKDALEKEEKINITDKDAQKMQQRNGEINASYSMTISVDTKADIITNYQTNKKDNDAEALCSVIEGSKERTRCKHDVGTADSGFFSIKNLESLKEMNQKMLMPDKRFEADKEELGSEKKYTKIHFKYDVMEDKYKCPSGKILSRTAKFEQNEREMYRYENGTACEGCELLSKCTRGKHRTITRDSNEKIKEEMRESLNIDANQEIYKKRAHSAESPTGQIKHNLKYRIFMRRGREKVNMEMGLLCMLHNILKIGKNAKR